MNSPAAQTMQADYPRPACAARRRRGRGEKRLILKGLNSQVATGPNQSVKIIRMVFGGRACKLRRRAGAPSEALSSGEGPGAVGEDCLRLGAAKPSSAADRVSWGRLFFGYFILAKQKKVRPPVNGGIQRIRKQSPRVRRRTWRLRKAGLLPSSKERPLIANQKGFFFVATAVFRR